MINQSLATIQSARKTTNTHGTIGLQAHNEKPLQATALNAKAHTTKLATLPVLHQHCLTNSNIQPVVTVQVKQCVWMLET